MQSEVLFREGHHEFILLHRNSNEAEQGVPSNQYLIRHGDTAALLDPGGFGVLPGVLTRLVSHIPPDRVKAIFLSHQDPDIIGGLASWLDSTPAIAYLPEAWIRFVPHVGLDQTDRVVGIPEQGTEIEVAPGFRLQIHPANFLHSPGQINVYDPIAHILFSGDIGAAVMEGDELYVDDFDTHRGNVEGFHRRYMAGNRALRNWLRGIEGLSIRQLAPQHGPVYRGEAVRALFDWLRDLRCGLDLMPVDELPG